MELIKVDEIPDKKLFNWYYGYYSADAVYPPVLAKIENRYYQLNKFNENLNEYLYIGKLTKSEALKASINLKSNINIVEFSNILYIAGLLNININGIEFFSKNNIKGSKLIEALRKVKFYPEAIKEYIISKDISFKYIILISQYLDKIGKALSQYVKEYAPTISDFRKYLYILVDYRDYIDLNNFNLKNINKIVSDKNKNISEFYAKFDELKNKLMPVKIENINNFETSQLIFSFAIINFIDYKNMLTQLYDKKESVNDFYNYMNKDDIY